MFCTSTDSPTSLPKVNIITLVGLCLLLKSDAGVPLKVNGRTLHCSIWLVTWKEGNVVNSFFYWTDIMTSFSCRWLLQTRLLLSCSCCSPSSKKARKTSCIIMINTIMHYFYELGDRKNKKVKNRKSGSSDGGFAIWRSISLWLA